jgi:hypothetical protein
MTEKLPKANNYHTGEWTTDCVGCGRKIVQFWNEHRHPPRLAKMHRCPMCAAERWSWHLHAIGKVRSVGAGTCTRSGRCFG